MVCFTSHSGEARRILCVGCTASERPFCDVDTRAISEASPDQSSPHTNQPHLHLEDGALLRTGVIGPI